jgi:hypothetical protein
MLRCKLELLSYSNLLRDEIFHDGYFKLAQYLTNLIEAIILVGINRDE